MKATKLKKAAQTTAACGRSTRVDTTVAIELAASCRPLRKSNASATRTSAIRIGKANATRLIYPPTAGAGTSDVLEHDPVDFVGDIVEPVHDLLQVIVDLHPDDERHRI